MKLVTYRHNGRTSIGKIEGPMETARVVDLPGADPLLPTTMLALLQAGPEAMARAKAADGGAKHAVALSAVTLLAPVPNPSKYLGIGMNYKKHVAEAAKVGDVMRAEVEGVGTIENRVVAEPA